MPAPGIVSRAPLVLRWLGAGLGVQDAVEVASDLASDGWRVALEPVPGRTDAAAELGALIGELRSAQVGDCELTLPTELGDVAVRGLARAAAAAGVRPAVGAEVLVPGATVVVRAGVPGAEDRCRALAAERVRLVPGRGRAAGLDFVRCLNVLMAASGTPAVGASDARLIAIAGERAAWYGRSAGSWEHVMPYGVLTDEQRRLAAAGHPVRVAVPFGSGPVAALARRIAGQPLSERVTSGRKPFRRKPAPLVAWSARVGGEGR